MFHNDRILINYSPSKANATAITKNPISKDRGSKNINLHFASSPHVAIFLYLGQL
jgi:hypothetical protein